MNRLSSTAHTARRRQEGAALVIVLILLLVMTWMGVSSMRGTTMGERMSAGVYDRSIAFQAAEAALREGEALAVSKPAYPTANCALGLCAERTDLTASSLLRWEDPAVAWREALTSLGVSNSGSTIVAAPEFVIEQMGDGPVDIQCFRLSPRPEYCDKPRVRVTARSNESDRARVVLQSYVSVL
jgi:type IV pilus assembly protein PilX